jgi:hypothetical protein
MFSLALFLDDEMSSGKKAESAIRRNNPDSHVIPPILLLDCTSSEIEIDISRFKSG